MTLGPAEIYSETMRLKNFGRQEMGTPIQEGKSRMKSCFWKVNEIDEDKAIKQKGKSLSPKSRKIMSKPPAWKSGAVTIIGSKKFVKKEDRIAPLVQPKNLFTDGEKSGLTLGAKKSTKNGRIVPAGTLLEAADHLLNMFDEWIIEFTKDKFKRDGIDLKTRSMVTQVTDKEIFTKERATGETKSSPYGMVVWSTGIGTRLVVMEFMKQLGQENRRSIATDEWLSVEGCNCIYALGDCAAINERKVKLHWCMQKEKKRINKDGDSSKSSSKLKPKKKSFKKPSKGSFSKGSKKGSSDKSSSKKRSSS